MEFILLGLLALAAGSVFLFDDDDDEPAAPPPERGEDDEVLGTDGNDTLSGDGDDTVRGGRGGDTITGRDNAVIRGGPGNDEIEARDATLANGNSGNDTLSLFDAAQGFGDAGDDLILANDASEGFGGAGDDGLSPRGASTVHGEAGDDRIAFTFESGEDAAGFGGEGDDALNFSGDAAGFADGGPGDDSIIVGQDADATVTGGAGDDRIDGDTDHVLSGGDGDDIIVARNFGVGTSVGLAEGNAGNDTIRGFVVTEGDGFAVDGGRGDDLLSWRFSARDGTSDADTLMVTGGAGADTFEIGLSAVVPFGAVDGPISLGTITDFDPEEDRLVIETIARDNIVTGIVPTPDAAENAVDLRIDLAAADTLAPLGTFVLRVEGTTTIDPEAVMVRTGTEGADTLDVTETGPVYTGAGDDTITVAGTDAFIDPGRGADVVTVADGAVQPLIDTAGDGETDTLNIVSGTQVVMDAFDRVTLAVTGVGAEPASLQPGRDTGIGPSDIDLPVEITLPDDWPLGRDLTFEVFERVDGGDLDYRLVASVGGQEVLRIAEPGYRGADEIAVTFFTPVNITLA